MSCQINTYRTWMRALKYFDSKDLDRSLYAFEMLPRTPRIYFNMGMVHAGLGDYSSAISCFQSAITDRSASAVEYFQLGALLFAAEDYEEAHKMFMIALWLMHGRAYVDLKPVGLDFRLYSCEILFNCAMSLLHLGKFEEGTSTLAAAREGQVYKSQIPCSREVFTIPALYKELDHASPRGDYCTAFQVPSRALYRPVNSTTDPFQRRSAAYRIERNIGINSTDGISHSDEKLSSHETFHQKLYLGRFKTERKAQLPMLE